MHFFLPQGVRTAITLVGGGAGDRGARARSKCEVGLSLCSVAVTSLSGAGSDPKLLDQVQAGSVPSKFTHCHWQWQPLPY